MAKICYKETRFKPATLVLIEEADAIVREYQEQGYDLTLRQLYYQLVARDIIPNRQAEYSRLGGIIKNARLTGLIDWASIVDRTRNVKSNPHWETPREILNACIGSFQMDKWRTQKCRPEVWIEKDALRGIIEGICSELDVPHFSCRGYTSISEMWGAGQRFLRWLEEGQQPIVIHLGDHDPSGINMSEDILKRLTMFMGADLAVLRIALNWDQIEKFNPPPNPAKQTDSRYEAYVQRFGDKCWELDALEPDVLVRLIRETVLSLRDEDAWEEAVQQENVHVATLKAMALKCGDGI